MENRFRKHRLRSQISGTFGELDNFRIWKNHLATFGRFKSHPTHTRYFKHNVSNNFKFDCKIILGITLKSEELSGSKSLVLKATLSGGKGDVGWQHAQLFRTKVDEHQSDYQFKLIVKLGKSDK